MRILQLQEDLRKRCIVLFRELQLENQGLCLSTNALFRVSDKVFCRNQADLVVVNIKCVWAAKHLILIPRTRYYYVNNTINLLMFNCVWPKPPEAEVDMHTNDDTARPEE